MYDCIFCQIDSRGCSLSKRLLLQQLDYRWVQTASWTTDSRITSLSWNLEGNRLLTGGDVLQLWHQRISQENEPETGDLPSVVYSYTMKGHR